MKPGILRVTCLAVLIFFSLFIHLAKASETIVYSEGFETGDGGYTLIESGNPALWQWGVPAVAVGPGAAHSGFKCWGTNLSGAMPRGKDGSIVSPAITLPSISGNQVIRVRFWGYVNVDGMHDRGELFISKDKVSWESLVQLYNKMETSSSAPATWHKYEFGIDGGKYGGGPIYLRFRAAMPDYSPSFYCGTSSDLSGFYIDDVAVTVYDVAGDRKIFTMEAWEDPSTWASCPWVAPWNGGNFHADNDIYSVARGAENEYMDFYRLTTPPTELNGVYPIEIQEREQEDSYTDYTALMLIDHAPDVSVAPDGTGNLNAYRPAALIPPVSASAGGKDVLSLVSTVDDKGVAAYNGDTVAIDFGAENVTNGAILVLRAAGFVPGEGPPQPYSGTPAIVVETLDKTGLWQERGRLLPRFAYSVQAFDLTSFLAGRPATVRLRSISHDVKYHAIDFVALYTGEKPPFTVSTVGPSTALFGSLNILGTLLTPDGNYFKMSQGEKFRLDFPVRPLAAGNTREFIFVSKGYYTPKGGSYLIYTWDGQGWVQRDGSTYPGSDTAKSFDLSLFLPDPAGDYKVRIWQDYQWEPAGIDYVNMAVGSLPAPLNYARDLKYNMDVYSTLLNSDNIKTSWPTCPRDRVVEVRFTPPVQNTPPTTNPVIVTNLASQTPTISWTYKDVDGDPEAQSQVQVWTGPGATGTIMWNPPVFPGPGVSVTYAGTPLMSGVTYYARVQANDGKDWGPWSEAPFVITLQICGDLNGDGVVNTVDYNIFRGAFGKKSGQAGFNAAADMDGDGSVSLKDYSAWYACYLKNR